MSDLTVHAEALIATVARAFYEDEAICVIDVLLRDKFLRDDDMMPRLSLPAKQLRRTLQFLLDENIVKFELVDDLRFGGCQATKFWYIDYQHAVNTIRLRIYLLRKKLEQAELRARSSSFYLCPGYKEKRCNGRYTETEAQQVLDRTTGLFLCQECVDTHAANPSPPPTATYTLQLVDNAKELKLAVDNMRRVNVQFSAKMIDNHQLRPGIYDLLQKVRGGKGRGPLSSNLPSENILLGIGSKRIAGTGRTAGIKAKKLAQQGVVESTDSAQSYLMGANEGSDLTFLKNAIGQEIAFTVVKGGGARANLLATNRQRRQKLMDAAASRVGADLPIYALMQKRKREAEELEREKKKNKTTTNAPPGLDFLKNNIGLTEREVRMEEDRQRDIVLDDEMEDYGDQAEGKDAIILADGVQEMHALSDEERRAKFQGLYKLEMERQRKVLNLEADKGADGLSLPQLTAEDSTDIEDSGVNWEDG
jgi:transcription initiation factor TFIIE subunit alpha